MKSFLTVSQLAVVAASFSMHSALAETPPVNTDVTTSQRAPVLSPVAGKINKQTIKSATPVALFSLLPESPTREQLEATQATGMALVSLADRAKGDSTLEKELAVALKSYGARTIPEDASALENYVSRYPSGPWTPGLRITVGVQCYHQGRFSEALDSFEKAWMGLKDSKDPKAIDASVNAAAELAGLYARLGRIEELRGVLKELDGRPISGVNTEKVRMAAEGLQSMTTMPEFSFKCGPYALVNIRKELGLEPALHPCIDNKKSTAKGISLAELQSLAGEMEMDWVAAERKPGAELPLPALVHWKVGHYAAVVRKMEDGRLLVRDPTFLDDFLITPEVFAQESSERFLVSRKALGSGWSLLPAAESAVIFGKGAPLAKDKDDAPTPCKRCTGMAAYDLDLFKAGLLIRDTPLWYNPPYGPAIEFNLMYRQHGEQVLDSYGFGPKWTSNWSSYLEQTDNAGNMVVFSPDGGVQSFFRNATDSGFIRQGRSQSELVKTSSSPLIYELRNSDGSKSVFSGGVNTAGLAKCWLISYSDARGSTVTLSYENYYQYNGYMSYSGFRLAAVTDALGQTSNLYYEKPNFPGLVTKISDPFTPVGGVRRSAHFAYDASGRLVKITDAEGIESSFTYPNLNLASGRDFITSMTTPYGTTSFETWLGEYSGFSQYVEVTDPLGRKERVEYRATFSGILPGSDPLTELPDSALIQRSNSSLYYGNTLHWDKKTYAHFPPSPATGLNYDKAVCHKWMWHPTVSRRPIGVISSIKKPFESRIWYEYPGQSGINIGNTELPSKIGRRVSATPAETQVDQYEYTERGNVAKHTDTLGRVRKWQYDTTTGMDLLNVKQQNGTTDETLTSYTYDPADPPHYPRTVTDASGQTTTFSWNARGQIDGMTQPGGLFTDWIYNPTGYLTSVDGPLAGPSDTTSHTYDLYGRVRTTTSPGSHTLTYDYDKLDRPTLVTHPDATTEQFSYQRQDGSKILEPTRHKDRENRWTLFGYNALRERISVTDPLNRETVFNWCYCGALQDLYDGEGNRTQWAYDIGGRLLKKTYADGKEENHTYDLTGRLATTTDAKGQVKSHSYHKDGKPAAIAYTNSQLPTANVSFTYDPIYGRLSTMIDGTGSTSYGYHPVNGTTLGAGNLSTIDGPLANDTIAHTYDALGRFKTRSINGSANLTTVDTYDALGRVVQLTNPLGSFTHTYDPVNLLPKTITAPNGLATTFAYQPAVGDLRLQEIKNQLPGATPLSTHGYTYSPSGNIKSWAQTTGTSPVNTWQIAYDRADQLEAATLTSAAAAVLDQQAWRYDKIGNRTSRSVGVSPTLSATRSAHNNRNQVTYDTPGGWMRIRGTTDEPATVKVRSNTNPFTTATTTAGNEFSGWVPVTRWANSITVEAKDTSPNATSRTNRYTVDVTGTARTPTYDLNGNTTSNGTGQTYGWDAENRLVKITHAGNTYTEFGYDGLSRRVRITEKNAANTITSDKRYLWAGGNQPAEERDAAGTTVLKQYHPQGEFIPAATAPLNKLFYTKDHLGSVRELVDASGTLQTRFDYDMWGKRSSVIIGSVNTIVGYTGHHHHARSGLILTWYRAYDAGSGRWLSPDPLEEEGGMNLYGYVENGPTNKWDPLGQDAAAWSLAGAAGGAAASGAASGSKAGPFAAVACGGAMAIGVTGRMAYDAVLEAIDSAARLNRTEEESRRLQENLSKGQGGMPGSKGQAREELARAESELGRTTDRKRQNQLKKQIKKLQKKLGIRPCSRD
jgi:RHS repeat-associated protein